MNSLIENYNRIKNSLPEHVTLIAVSKTQPAEAVQAIYDMGQRSFGENKVQELTAKYQLLPKDIEWHLIGHLQSNKVKYIAPFVHLIHSVDSLSLLQTINKEGAKNNRIISCLLQFHIATEDTKFGLNKEEAVQLLSNQQFAEMKWVKICGVMGMATFTDDTELVAHEFAHLSEIFNFLKKDFFSNSDDFNIISMGMSDDYELAIAQGSNMVRLGTSIFGERNYAK